MSINPTKLKLLDAAGRIFLEHGFDAASMDAIRIEAGVSNGSLYHHYPTKAQLATALYEYTLRDFHAALLKAVSDKLSAEAGVKGLVRAYIRWVVAHPERARLLHQLRRGGMAESESGWSSANMEAFGKLSAWIAQKVEQKEMRPLSLPVWMALVFAPAKSLTPQWVSQAQPSVSPGIRAELEHGAWQALAP
jgi:AcrR family transcriptional regulator